VNALGVEQGKYARLQLYVTSNSRRFLLQEHLPTVETLIMWIHCMTAISAFVHFSENHPEIKWLLQTNNACLRLTE